MTAIDMPGKTTSDERLQHLVDANSRAVLGDTHVEPTSDMAAERRRATIDSGALAVFMNGGAAKLQRKCVLMPHSVPVRPQDSLIFLRKSQCNWAVSVLSRRAACVWPHQHNSVAVSTQRRYSSLSPQARAGRVPGDKAVGGQDAALLPHATGGVQGGPQGRPGHLVRCPEARHITCMVAAVSGAVLNH